MGEAASLCSWCLLRGVETLGLNSVISFVLLCQAFLSEPGAIVL